MARKSAVLFALTCLLLSGCPIGAYGAEALKPAVVINEIAWMGNGLSASKEWIELYNYANYGINLMNWSLESSDSLKIKLTGTIPAKGFYLLERTSDQTLPDIAADQIFKGAMPNKGLDIKLYDKNRNLADQIDCSQGWFSGDNGTKQTMERVSPENQGNVAANWQTSLAPGGTPKAQNSLGAPEKEKTVSAPDLPAEAKKDPAGIKTGLGASISDQAGSLKGISPRSELSAFGFAALSGIIVLYLKRNLKDQK
ncbi:MAG: lamin tail domain-containing protein [Candidatus Paceibacterota bacterium]|jgi:hypothetical protein